MDTPTLGDGIDRSRPPSLKLRNPGDHVTVAIVDMNIRPRYVFGTRDPLIGKDGRPKQQEVYTALIIDAADGIVSTDGTDRPALNGELVSLFVPGHKRWARITAYKETLADRDPKVGDVWTMTYTHDEKAERAGLNPRQVHKFDVRDARPDEDTQTAQCVDLYRARNTVTQPDAYAGHTTYGDEEPF